MFSLRSLCAAATLMTCVIASCASKMVSYKTPFGPLVIDSSRRSSHQPVRLSGEISIYSSADVKNRIKRYGFFTGSGADQVHASELVLQTVLHELPIPERLTRDLWNLNFPTAHISEAHRIAGLDGYAVHGGDGEQGYTVIFFYRGTQCVGRVVSTVSEDVFQSMQGDRIVLRTWYPPEMNAPKQTRVNKLLQPTPVGALVCSSRFSSGVAEL